MKEKKLSVRQKKAIFLMVNTDKSISDIAKEVKKTEPTIHNWKKKALFLNALQRAKDQYLIKWKQDAGKTFQQVISKSNEVFLKLLAEGSESEKLRIVLTVWPSIVKFHMEKFEDSIYTAEKNEQKAIKDEEEYDPVEFFEEVNEFLKEEGYGIGKLEKHQLQENNEAD